MLDAIAGQLDGPPRGGLYYACVGRGEHMFDGARRSRDHPRAARRFPPLRGSSATARFLHDRLYGYTGVLTLFR